MKTSKFTDIGYPAGNKLIRDHMKKMVAIGETHDHIKKVNKSLRDLEKLLQESQVTPQIPPNY